MKQKYTPKIIVRRAVKGETLLTLDDVKRKLDDDMLMITDNAGLIAIAGVMGKTIRTEKAKKHQCHRNN